MKELQMAYHGGMKDNIELGNEITELLSDAIRGKLSVLAALNNKSGDLCEKYFKERQLRF